jgi:hypothetical protein
MGVSGPSAAASVVCQDDARETEACPVGDAAMGRLKGVISRSRLIV